MAQRNSRPIAWRPKGCSDTLESSEAFPGAMQSLANLVPDPTTMGLFQCRPAAIQLSGFATFTTPGFVSITHVFGQYVYGMVASGLNPGYDQPFVFNLATGAFLNVTGITGNNVPASPSISGAWTPPTMDVIGSRVVVTHPGFSGSFGAFFGYFDISTPTAPVWHGGNCMGASFPSFTVPPSAVRQFGGRAYFIHNLSSQPAVIFSDELNPLTNSAGGIVPILTFNDNVPLTALGGLPLNTTTGGIIQALMVFKGTSNIFQITGDPTSTANPLFVNALNVPTGTQAPATVVPTPFGLAFISPDGLRVIDFTARVSDVIGRDGNGISVPFTFSNVPSRMVAAANGSVIRITTQNAYLPGTPFQEWWYDFGRKIWTGPHTCAMTSLSEYNNTFIGVLQGVNAKLWQADYEQSVTSTYLENGTQLTFNYTTSLLPDTDQMTNNNMTQSTLDLAFAGSTGAVGIIAYDQNAVALAGVAVSATGSVPLWGQVNWGAFIWGGVQSALAPRIIPWPISIDFVRMQIQAIGNCASAFKIGTLHLRYKIGRFLVDIAATGPTQFTLDQSQLDGTDVLG